VTNAENAAASVTEPVYLVPFTNTVGVPTNGVGVVAITQAEYVSV
jgi:hypothetical protein